MAESIPSTDDKFSIVSYNIHGFNQGKPGIEELLCDYSPDFLFVQEHWLTPENMSKLDCFTEYMYVGISAMRDAVMMGPLIGRPFGGVTILVRKALSPDCLTVCCNERMVCLKFRNFLFFNVYLPCIGIADRILLVESLLNDIRYWCSVYPRLQWVIAGDFNTDLASTDPVAVLLSSLATDLHMSSCYSLYPGCKFITYVHDALGHQSLLDYFLCSDMSSVISCEVVELDINFSDHYPVLCQFTCMSRGQNLHTANGINTDWDQVRRLRWDHADIGAYQEATRLELEPLYAFVEDIARSTDQLTTDELIAIIDTVYVNIVRILVNSANITVPRVGRKFFKFWWNEDLSESKSAAIASNRAWRDAGKPRSGPVFNYRQRCRLQYRKKLRDGQRSERDAYSNDLHDALLRRDSTAFWRQWKSKFDRPDSRDYVVEGSCDPVVVAGSFVQHFKSVLEVNLDAVGVSNRSIFEDRFRSYVGGVCYSDYVFNVATISRIIEDGTRGKACGLDTLSVEHLQHSHPALVCILCRLFNWMMVTAYVPTGFCESYTVPLPKDRCSFSIDHKCSEFRGIAISNIIPKIFEKCLLHVFGDYLITADNQFGFKRKIGCTHAIYSVQTIVNGFITGGDTANLCALDVSKAFDCVDHYALLLKLLDRNVPTCLVQLLNFWLSNCATCIKWKGFFSGHIRLTRGVRQGSVLSPVLFAILVNDVIVACNASSFGYILMYADDILLCAASVCCLQRLVNIVVSELSLIGLQLNVKKSCCVRIGPRFNNDCASINTLTGETIPWMSDLRYLGVEITGGRKFSCSMSKAKGKFNGAVNSVIGKLENRAHEDVLIQLIKTKCLPILLYGTEACALNKAQLHSLDFAVIRVAMKIFKTTSRSLVSECMDQFAWMLPSVTVSKCERVLVERFRDIDNYFFKRIMAKFV